MFRPTTDRRLHAELALLVANIRRTSWAAGTTITVDLPDDSANTSFIGKLRPAWPERIRRRPGVRVKPGGHVERR